MPVVQRWIESQALQDLAVIEARRRLIHEEPDVRRVLRERANNYLLEGIYTREVIYRSQVTEDDLRAAHARIASSMIRLDQAKVVTVTLPDSATATQLGAAAAAIAPGARARTETVRYPNEDPFWGPMQGRLIGMRPGEVAGPYPGLNGGWVLVELTSKQQGAQSYENLPPMVLQQLNREALEMKREQRLTALTDSLRRAIPVAVYADRLKKIPWPPPAASEPRA
jgi:hypothetical protein